MHKNIQIFKVPSSFITKTSKNKHSNNLWKIRRLTRTKVVIKTKDDLSMDYDLLLQAENRTLEIQIIYKTKMFKKEWVPVLSRTEVLQEINSLLLTKLASFTVYIDFCRDSKSFFSTELPVGFFNKFLQQRWYKFIGWYYIEDFYLHMMFWNCFSQQ